MPNIHTPSEQVKVVHGLAAAITAAATQGATADTLGFEDALVIVRGAPSGTGTTVDFKLQDSADDSSYADVTSGAFTQMTTVGGAKLYVMNVKCSNHRRYLQITHTGAGGSAAGVSYGLIILLNPRRAPVSQANTALSV